MIPEPSDSALHAEARSIAIEARSTEMETLPSVAQLHASLPRSPSSADLVERTRAAIRAALHGRDPERILVVVGPCSIHSRDAALAYADRLERIMTRTADRLILVMRTYFEKPRTSVGWKGLIHDPHLDDSGAIGDGLELARRLLCELNERGVPCASELLDPLVAPYLVDLLSWAAIGARTSESQIHRELASGLPLPIGFKNSTSGDLSVAVHAMVAAQRPHSRLEVAQNGALHARRTSGNPDAHLVLRGGHTGPNYFPEPVQLAIKRGREQGTRRPVVVDCSHGNSGFDPARQPEVCREVISDRSVLANGVLGVQLESHIEAGSQRLSRGRAPSPVCSITDPCMGWKETERLLLELASL